MSKIQLSEFDFTTSCELCVVLFPRALRKKGSPNPGVVNQVSASLWGQLDSRSAKPHTGSFTRNPRRVRKSPERDPGQDPKSAKEYAPESQKSQKRVKNLTFGLFLDCFGTLLRLRGALFGHFLRSCPGVLFPDSFRTLPGFRARRARETLCGAGPIAKLDWTGRIPKSFKAAFLTCVRHSLVTELKTWLLGTLRV